MKYPWYVAFSYLIYVIFWDAGLIGGAAYLVYWRDQSGWLIVAALIIGGCGYHPWKWAALYDPSVAHRLCRKDEAE